MCEKTGTGGKKMNHYENSIPVCCKCKKIRNDKGKEPGTGKWIEPAVYLIEKVKIKVIYSFCSKCITEMFTEFDALIKIKINQSKK